VQKNLKQVDGFEIRSFWSEFRDTKIEQAFLHHHLERGQNQLRIALIVCSLFYLAFALTDFATLGYSHEFLILFMARLLVAITAMAAIYLIQRNPLSLRIPVASATLTEIVGMGTFMLVTMYRPHEIPWHAMALAIMLIVVYLFIPNRLIYAAGVALASTAIFIFISIKVGNLIPSDILRMIMSFTLANLFGAVAARRYQLLWREEFRTQSLLKRQTVRDHLTGCYNRRYLFDDLLEKEISRAQRHKLSLTIMLCDLDHFKSVNDTYGHQTGDAVLCAFSALLQENTRDHVDYVIRYGGEEFLLLLPDTDLAGGTLLAERLRVALAENISIQNMVQDINLTSSFGVATINYSTEGKSISQQAFIAAADELLYAAKHSGRNLVKSREL
jgi:diguanylate cyclase (GGDEF)-like protein